MKNNPKVLGKGLGALLGDMGDIESLRKPLNNSGRESVDIKLVDPNPYQPRLEFDERKIDEMAVSIKALGLIQPVTLRRTDNGRYQIISGERRLRACVKAGMETVPAYVREADDRGMLEMSIVENIQRENLDPIEIALSYKALMEECDLTQEEMSGRIGKKRASIANFLRLLRLPDKVQHDLRAGLISVGHAKVLLGIPDEKMQQKLCDLVISNGLSVRELEQKIAEKTPKTYDSVAERLKEYFSGKVSFKRGGDGKGSITIRFGSDEEVEEFLKSLKK